MPKKRKPLSKQRRRASEQRRRSVGFETLEDRRVLSASTLRSFNEVRDLLEQPTAARSIDYVTVVTHGFAPGENGDTMRDLALLIQGRSQQTYEAIDNETMQRDAWLLDYDQAGDLGNGVFDFAPTNGSVVTSEPADLDHLVLLFDWAPESNEPSSGWGEAAGDALFSMLVGLGIVDLDIEAANPKLHFIGHSFGTVVTSEAVERLGNHNVSVAQVTYLDPHDFAQGALTIDWLQDLSKLGEPIGYGATRWNNIEFVDTYYQTRSLPDGRPIPGAYNRLVNADVSTASLPHSAVWNSFYLGTVFDSGSDTGYVYSPFRQDFGSLVPRPDDAFDPLTSLQDHDHTELPDGESFRSLENARWAPQRAPRIFNGSFNYSGDKDKFQVPGWSYHGGGGTGFVITEDSGNFLRLTRSAGSTNTRASNRLVVPTDSVGLRFDVRDSGARTETDDILRIEAGSNALELSLATLTQGWNVNERLAFDIPFFSPTTILKFTHGPGDDKVFQSEVDIDDVSFVIDSNLDTILDAYNAATFLVRSGTAQGLTQQALGTTLPLVNQSVEEITSSDDIFLQPFLSDIEAAASSSLGEAEGGPVGSSGLGDLADQITVPAGFELQYAGTTPDASGDYLRLRYSKTIDAATVVPELGQSWGIDYFDLKGNFGNDNTVNGSLSAAVGPITIELIVGVDETGGTPTFFISEDSFLEFDGLTVSGLGIDTNMAIANLLDVDIAGALTGSIGGGLRFSDPDPDNKLRIGQLQDPTQIIQPNLQGHATFSTDIKARLPIIGELAWGGSFGVQFDNGTVETFEKLDAPTIDVVGRLLQAGMEQVLALLNPTGGTNLDAELPFINESLGSVLGLPKELLQGGLLPELGGVNISEDQILKLINGEVVDLFQFSASGEKNVPSEKVSIPLAAAGFAIGPIPVTASLSFDTTFSAGYRYHVGVGIDTSGIYLDPRTSVSARGQIEAGLTGKVGILAIASVEVTAGVGGTIDVGIGLEDPDPSDGKIYLDEIFTAAQTSDGQYDAESLLQIFDVHFSGEAYGFAKGLVSFLFWNWEIFNERISIASFGDAVAASNRTPIANAQSQRNVSGRSPVGSGELTAFQLVDKVLTIDASQLSYADQANSVVIDATDAGNVRLNWRGVGVKEFEANEVDEIRYIGNDHDDYFYVGTGIAFPVTATGGGGDDVLRVESAPATLEGGTGNDQLTGGSASVTLRGGSGFDRLTGSTANDILDGGAGDDRLSGGPGDDTLQGGSGNDSLQGDQGNDILAGDDGEDVLLGGVGDDTLDGGSGQDTLDGQDGDDTLLGGDHDDRLIGGRGNDNISGGSGDDVIFGDSGNGEPEDIEGHGDDILRGDSGSDLLFGQGGADQIDGDQADDVDPGDDLIVGGAGDDTLKGFGGNDQIFGNIGSDLLEGGDGDDVLDGGDGADILRGGNGEDTLQLAFTGNDFENDLSGGGERDRVAIVGEYQEITTQDGQQLDSNFDDHIRITHQGGNSFIAQKILTVNDQESVDDEFSFTLDVTSTGDIEEITVMGLGGDDILEVGAEPNVVDPLDGRDFVLEGGVGDDTLIGGQGRDILRGGPGNDTLRGNGNDDLLYGDAGKDDLDGGLGNDFLDAGEGDDRILAGGDSREVVEGDAGDDYIIASRGLLGTTANGGPGNDIIIGGPGKDDFSGGAGDDIILGGANHDSIAGDEGDDVLIGEWGRDQIDGGPGNDSLYAHVNNATRLDLGLEPIPELTKAEMLSHEIFNVGPKLDQLQSRSNELRLLPNRSQEEEQELREVSNQLDVLRTWRSDLDFFQQSTIDRLEGDSGDDRMFGSPFADELVGGDGDDHFFAGHRGQEGFQGDIIVGDGQGGPFSDTLWYDGTDKPDTVTFRYALSDAGNPLVEVVINGREIPFERPGIENVGVRTFSGHDNITINTVGPVDTGVFVDAGDGDDFVDASAQLFPVTLIGGSGADTLIGGTHDDYLVGEDGDDILIGGAGMNVLIGGLGDDTLRGGDESDELYGGPGADELSGGGGTDYLDGGPDDDLIESAEGDPTVVLRPGNDSVVGSFGYETQNLVTVGEQQIPIEGTSFKPFSKLANGLVARLEQSNMGVDGGPITLVAKRYSADGRRIGVDQTLSQTPINGDSRPEAFRLSNGEFTVIWGSDIFGSSRELFARRFDENFHPLTNEYPINYSPSQHYFSSVGSVDDRLEYQVAPNGNILVIQAGTVNLYDSDGQPLRDPASDFYDVGFLDYSAGDTSIAFYPDGTFIVATPGYFLHDGGTTYYSSVQIDRYSSKGDYVENYWWDFADPPQGFNLVNLQIELLSLPDDRFAIAKRETVEEVRRISSDFEIRSFHSSEVTIQEFASGGNTDGPIELLELNTQEPLDIGKTQDLRGGLMLVWWKGDCYCGAFPGTPPYEATAMRFEPDGSVIGDQFRLLQSESFPGGLHLDLDPKGSFVVVGQELLPDQATNSYVSSLYMNHANEEPPTFTSFTLESDRMSAKLVASELLATSDQGSVSDTSHWTLSRGDQILPEAVEEVEQIVTEGVEAVEIRVTFSEALPPGDYILTASGSIGDFAGRLFDGNADGVSGDDFVQRFVISSPPIPIGPETNQSTAIPSGYFDTDAVVDPNTGETMVVWTEPAQDGESETSIIIERLDSQGSPVPGSRTTANAPDDQSHSLPAVAMDSLGTHVVVWNSYDPDDQLNRTFLRRYSANGEALDSDAILVSTQASDASTVPNVAMNSDGDAVIVWRANVDGSAEYFNWYRRLDAEGHLSDSVLIEALGTQLPGGVAKAGLDGQDQVVVAWSVANPSGAVERISVRHFDSGDKAGLTFGGFSMPNQSLSTHRLAMNKRGQAALTWQSGLVNNSDIQVQRFEVDQSFGNGPTLRTVGTVTQVNSQSNGSQASPNVGIDGDGNALVTWIDNVVGVGHQQAYRWFDYAGNRFDTEVMISEADGPLRGPISIAMKPNGDFSLVRTVDLGTSGESRKTQSFTRLKPQLLRHSFDAASKSIRIEFDQEMATAGSGSVLNPANWSLKLPDGRYLVQGTSDTSAFDLLATNEQFGEIEQFKQTDNAVWEIQIPLAFSLSVGEYQLIARSTIQNKSGVQLNSDVLLAWTLDGPSPKVLALILDDGDSGRSQVRSLTAEFDSPVVIGEGAFELMSLGKDTPPIPIQATPLQYVNDRWQTRLSFDGPMVHSSSGSLLDGRYQIRIRSELIHSSQNAFNLDGDNDGSSGGDRVDEFFRFFGDSDGDADVDLIDMNQFRAALNSQVGNANFDGAFDFDGNGRVDGTDLAQMRRRLLRQM